MNNTQEQQDIFLSIDLELESPKSNPNTHDSITDSWTIIQLGISVFSLGKSNPIFLENVCLTINYPHKLSAYIEKLTGITSEEVNTSTITLQDAIKTLRQLREKHNASRILVQWGHGDFEALKEHDTNNDLEVFGRSAYNVKHLFMLFAVTNRMKRRSGLSKSMGKLGLTFDGNIDGKQLWKHNALADAYNTARIFNRLLSLMKRPGIE